MTFIIKYLMLSTFLTSNLLSSSIAFARGNEEESAIPSGTVPEKTKKKKKTNDKDNRYYASLGLGKTLPESFYRIRLLNRYSHGDRFIDEHGKAQDVSYELTAASSALTIEYGRL